MTIDITLKFCDIIMNKENEIMKQAIDKWESNKSITDFMHCISFAAIAQMQNLSMVIVSNDDTLYQHYPDLIAAIEHKPAIVGDQSYRIFIKYHFNFNKFNEVHAFLGMLTEYLSRKGSRQNE